MGRRVSRSASPSSPEGPVLVDGHWQKLDLAANERDRFAAMLTIEEERHASRFHFARDCCRYIVRRGRLRELLAKRLGRSSKDVALCFNRFLKPALEGDGLSFCLSHSH